MLALDTKRITTSRDIRWLDKSYSEWNKEKPIENEDNDNEQSKSLYLSSSESASNCDFKLMREVERGVILK